MTWHRDFAANLSKFQRGIPYAEPGYVIYAGDLFPRSEDFSALSYEAINRIFS